MKIKKAGLTLVEIVVSLALLAIFGMVFVSLFLSSTSTVSSMNQRKQAELELRKFAEGLQGAVPAGIHVSCTAGSSMNVTVGGSALIIEGSWCTAMHEETGVQYEYFKRHE